MEVLAMIGRLLPRATVRELGASAMAAGIEVNDEVAAGVLIIVACAIAVAAAVVASYVIPAPPELGIAGPIVVPIAAAVGVTAFALFVVYEALALAADRRRVAVEAVLPDFLQLAAANIRAGMPIDRALWHAARPEFGLLANEVELASRKTFSGEPFDIALADLAARFRSRYLDRTIELIKSAIAAGGEIATILEKTSFDVRNAQIMRREIVATMTMYAMLIMFAAVVGAPLLLAISTKLIALFERLEEVRGVQVAAPLPMRFGAPGAAISSADFANFATVLIVITCALAALIVAVINTGRKREALRYIFPFLIVAFAVFFGSLKLLEGLGY